MITFLGDVALISQDISSEYKPKTPYIFNFEYVTGNRLLLPVEGKINIFSENTQVEKIFGKPPTAVSVANNHTLDFGKEGFCSTINAIKEKNVIPIGGRTFFENESVCVFAYTIFGGYYEDENIVAFSREKAKLDIDGARNRGIKRIIVNMHWGIEHMPLNNNQQTEIGHWLIDNGVDLIIGHHSHCIQPVEKYKEKYIFYGLGNCLFPNFSLDSHYDENGKPKRKYRVRWQRWSRKSLAVCYDEMSGEVFVDELIQEKNKLILHKKNVSLSKYTKKISKTMGKIKYVIRKYYLFFISNFCVDGKLFDMQALKFEVRKNG